jgi:hypothetical protein
MIYSDGMDYMILLEEDDVYEVRHNHHYTLVDAPNNSLEPYCVMIYTVIEADINLFVNKPLLYVYIHNIEEFHRHYIKVEIGDLIYIRHRNAINSAIYDL